jgi:hypothetical protein
MKKLLVIGTLLCTTLAGGNAFAAASASWEGAGQSYTVGTNLNVSGSAGASGSTSGLDIALVLDSSGSMYGSGQVAQRVAANALVASLPTTGVSVAVIDFDYSSSADTPLGLTSLSTASGIASVNAAINSIDASGGTNIAAGITAAATTLTGPASTATSSQVMIVMSDGGSSVSAAEVAADAAIVAGVDAIYSVGMGDYVSSSALKAVVNGVDDEYGNSDDYGTYSSASFDELLNLLTAGGLVGIDTVDITDGDGNDVFFTLSGLGDVMVNYNIGLGENILNMSVLGTDGSLATAQWTATGTDNVVGVPEPSTIFLLGLGLVGLVFNGRKKSVYNND